MALTTIVKTIGTSDVTLFTCPLTLEGSAHTIFALNKSGGSASLTLKFFDQSEGTTEIIDIVAVATGDRYTFPKTVNMNAGDELRAASDVADSFQITLSVYTNAATPAATGLNPRGVWNSGADYNPNDYVELNGTAYAVITANTNDQPPSANWMTLAAKGETGNAGADGADGTGTVNSVNGVLPDGAGAVSMTPDDLDDASSTHKFHTADDISTTEEFRNNTADKFLQTDKVWSAAAEATLTDAANIDVDMNAFLNAVVTLAGNRTLDNPTNAKPGQTGRIRIVQDATGGRTLSFGSNYKFDGGGVPALSTAAGAEDILYYDVISANRIEIYSQLNRGN